MKSQIFNKEYIYPDNWNDDDKIKFKFYLNQARQIYQKLPDDILMLAIHHQIKVERGEAEEITEHEIIKTDIKPYEEIKTVIEAN
jgi:hypothetical protein